MLMPTKKWGLAIALGLVLLFVGGLIAEADARFRGGGGGGFYRPSYTQMQPRTMPVQRPMPSQMQARPMMQPSRMQPGMTGNRGFAQQQGARAVRQLPPSIRTSAPIARVPAFTGRVTTAGSPILATRAGRAFAVPQQATFSTRMSLMSGTSRPALMARMGEPRRLELKKQFNAVASGNDLRAQLLAAKVGSGPLWTADKSRNLSGIRSAYRHYVDHGKDFGSRNAVEYVRAAQRFIRNPPPGTLTRIRKNGDMVRYHPQSNTFSVSTQDGAVRTFMKPDPAVHGRESNMRYFLEQQ